MPVTTALVEFELYATVEWINPILGNCVQACSVCNIVCNIAAKINAPVAATQTQKGLGCYS